MPLAMVNGVTWPPLSAPFQGQNVRDKIRPYLAAC